MAIAPTGSFRRPRRTHSAAGALLALLVLLPAAAAAAPGSLVVTSLLDLDPPPAGRETLRSAIRRIAPGGRITFAPALDGGTIELSTVAEEHTVLVGEYFEGMVFKDYRERDYGRSALAARKSLVIDASALPRGVTLRWAGGDASPARVLAILGDLTMRRVTVTGGVAASEPIDPASPFAAQLHTLGRGGGIAVWGTARLRGCTVHGNRAAGDENGSRDRGAFGGGLYANLVDLEDCTVSGNAVIGYGASGGGVHSVGGAGLREGGSRIVRCAVTGNRVTAQHAYGGGVYSDGGGPGNDRTILLKNSTIAGNLVEDHPGLPQAPSGYYYRGGGFYMSNGSVIARSCTIVGNAVTGFAGSFGKPPKPNLGGGGMAATIGNAHVVESMTLEHSIVAGNTVNGAAEDVYSGSLLDFISLGYNLVGRLDLSQTLVPVPAWEWLSRKHWPKVGDRDGVAAADALDLAGARLAPGIVSVGADAGAPAVLWFPPRGPARDAIPASPYRVRAVNAGFHGNPWDLGAFLEETVARVASRHAAELGPDFAAGFAAGWAADREPTYGPVAALTFTPVPNTWPGLAANAGWIAFWRYLDERIAGRLGAAGLGDDFWASWEDGPWGATVGVATIARGAALPGDDQRRHARPRGARGDIGAIER